MSSLEMVKKVELCCIELDRLGMIYSISLVLDSLAAINVIFAGFKYPLTVMVEESDDLIKDRIYQMYRQYHLGVRV